MGKGLHFLFLNGICPRFAPDRFPSLRRDHRSFLRCRHRLQVGLHLKLIAECELQKQRVFKGYFLILLRYIIRLPQVLNH